MHLYFRSGNGHCSISFLPLKNPVISQFKLKRNYFAFLFYRALQTTKKTSINDVNAKSAAENDDGKVERWLLYGSSNFDEEFLFKFVQFLAILFHHNEIFREELESMESEG